MCIHILVTLAQIGVFKGAWCQSVEPIQIWLDEFENLRLRFEHDPSRRYTVEESSNLISWTEHWVSPWAANDDNGEGYSTGTIGLKKQYFVRLRSLPWVFTPVFATEDRLGELNTAFNQDDRLTLLYQNRTTNSLYLTEQLETGAWSEPELVATTGVPDEPSFWDNNGYHEVQNFILPEGTHLITCVDDYNNELICLIRPPSDSAWTRHIIAEAFGVPAWVTVTAAVSRSETLAIAYGDSDGCFLFTAPIADIGSGDLLQFSTENPPAGSSAIVFTPFDEVMIQMGDEVRVDPASKIVTPSSIPGNLDSSLTPDGALVSTKIGSTGVTVYRSADNGAEWSATYIPLGEIDDGQILFGEDGRVVTLADWYGRLVVHDAASPGAVDSLRIANGREEPGDFFLYPDGKLGVVLFETWGDGIVTLARQE